MKDHATFLAAFAAASPRAPRLRAVLVGGAAAASSPCGVVRLGWRRDMRAVYSGLDFLCLSSSFGEGMPNVVAEAMACETPCIVTDVGDATLLVGDTGTVVPARDVPRLADALVAAAETPFERRREAGRLARLRIDARFGAERLVDDTLRAFAAVGLPLGGRASPQRT
jgi:glycosyltransferase involved in cell wall biosynthesis